MQDKAISNEELARIYGAYLGSTIIYNSTIYDKKLQRGKLLSVCSYTLEILIGRAGTDNDMSTIGNSRLELSPLSDITDEHAIGVAKQFAYHPSIAEDYDNIIEDFSVDKIIRRDNCIIVKHTLICFEGEFILYYDGAVEMVNDDDGKREGQSLNPQATDYLRQQGYDLGFGSIPSLIQAGIATKKEGGNG